MAVVAVGILAIGVGAAVLPGDLGPARDRGPDELGLGPCATPRASRRSTPTTPSDLFRAQGFVSAQDRFFEMDLRRHVTAGRLPSSSAAPGSTATRSSARMGWRRVAEQELPTLAPETRQYLQAYADGVNAYIKQAGVAGEDVAGVHRARAPQPRLPRRAVDARRLARLAQGDGVGPARQLQGRAGPGPPVAHRRASVKQVDLLYPPYPVDRNQPILSGRRTGSRRRRRPTRPASPAPAALTALRTRRTAGAAVDSALASVDAVPAQPLGAATASAPTRGSSSGARTTTGKPLLANDPHLGLAIPGIWDQVNLQCRTRQRRVPVPGLGLHLLGPARRRHRPQRQGRVGDDQPRPRRHRLLPRAGLRATRTCATGQPAARDERQEIIKVAGGADVPLTVRSHGARPDPLRRRPGDRRGR